MKCFNCVHLSNSFYISVPDHKIQAFLYDSKFINTKITKLTNHVIVAETQNCILQNYDV